MAQSSGIFGFILLAGVSFAALYLTKQFCPNGAIPTDLMNGRLCYQGTVFDDIIPISSAEQDAALAKCPSCKAGQSKMVRSDGKCGCIDVGSNIKIPTSTVSTTRCSGTSGNCSWDCKNATCWKSTGPKVDKICIQGTSDRNVSCQNARNAFIKANSGTGQQGAYGGPAPAPAPASGPTAVQVLNAKLFIADVINRVVQACTGYNVGTTKIVQSYPSAMTSMAQMNHYSQNTLVKTSVPFAQYFRKVVLAVVGAYKLNLSPICTQQMSCLASKSMSQCGL